MKFDKSKNEVELGDYIDHIKGNAFKSRDMNKNNDVPVIKVKNFTADSIEVDTSDLLPKSFVVEYERYLLKENDILISTVGSWPSNPESVVGKVVRVPNLKKKLLLNQNIVKVFSTSQYLDNSFLFWVLKSENFKQFIISKAQGSANQASITLKSIDTYTFELPSIEEQREISEFLNNIQNKIELNNQMIATLEELTATLFKRWFVDFEFPDENGNPYKSSGGKMVDSELGEIPEGWEVNSIFDRCIITGGGTPKTDIFDYWDGKIPFYTPKDAKNFLFVNDTEKHISLSGLNNSSTRLYKSGTIFITARGTVGKINIAAKDMAMNQSCYAITNKNGNQYFIYNVLSRQVKLIKASSNGAVFNAITTRDFKLYKFSIPKNDELINLFEDRVNSFYEKCRNLILENDNLREMRDYLLPKFLSGDILLK
ncbi:restriction endonuclease subunit S [Enterococcus hirae]|uniref:restriction endonuclease subunit S n=1 Tax=Enterococcus hirae TaxID=1354 RepID=UPI002DB73C53|nr:restriction endonuclease subunit S [Enterococcus hirae]MEB7406495.1 restriction endonuclease subunit S [Enterococcus hirae]